MYQVSPVGKNRRGWTASPGGDGFGAATRPPPPQDASGADVALSLTGLTVVEAMARVDAVRIRELRRRIEAGTYLTEEQLDVVVDRIFGLLHEEGSGRRATA